MEPGSETTLDNVAVLASGSGTLLDAILSEGIPVALVLTDRPCKATEVADRHGVASVVHERASFGPSFDREAYTEEVAELLAERDIDLVVMAGYGTVFGQAIHDAYPFRILNTHPALLPAFKGWHAVRDALAYGVKLTGCTVHLVDEQVDHGPIVAQEAVAVRDDDTEDRLHGRIQRVEHRLLPATVKLLCHDALELDGRRVRAAFDPTVPDPYPPHPKESP